MANQGSGITGYFKDLQQNRIFPLSGVTLRIGHEDDCEIQCEGKVEIPRCHGRLWRFERAWYIQNVCRNAGGITVNARPVLQFNFQALSDGDEIVLTNETVTVYKFFTEIPLQNTDTSETSSAAANAGQEGTGDVNGSTTRVKKQMTIAGQDHDEPEDRQEQPAGTVDETELINTRLLQATQGRNSLDLTRHRMQNLDKENQARRNPDLQDEQLKEMKREISELRKKLSDSEDKRRRMEVELDLATNLNVELLGNLDGMTRRNLKLRESLDGMARRNLELLDRMTSRDSDIQKILEDEAGCSICLEIVVIGHETECHHLFCHTCISGWTEQGLTCPECRGLILTTQENKRVNNIVRRLYSVLPEHLQREREEMVDERRQLQAQRDFNTEDELPY